MPRRLPAYAYRETTRHGRAVYYFRWRKGTRTRLPAYGSDGFEEAYQAVRLAMHKPPPRKATAGSLAWLIGQYRASGDYLSGYAAATRRQRDNIFYGVIGNSGHVAFSSVTSAKIRLGIADRAHTPSQARNFLDAMRALFQWAAANQHVAEDPTLGIKAPRRIKGDGFAPWTDEEVEAYEARWPTGTKERVWLAVLLCTGLRRGDAVVVGRQHIKDGLIVLKTEKGRSRGVMVYIPVFDALTDAIQRGPVGDLSFIAGDRGRPLTKESFGNVFRAACNAAGVKKSAHGLRKLAASRAAEHGLTVAELEAMFGWTGGTMASFYTKSADRRRLAKLAAGKIGNTNAPHLAGHSPAPKKISIE